VAEETKPLPPAEPAPKEKRSWLMGCLMTVLIVLCALLITGSCWSCHVKNETAQLSRHVRELADEARAEMPQVAPEDDAAPLYLQAFTLYQRPPRWGSGTTPDAEELARYISGCSAYLQALKLATAKPGCSFAFQEFEPGTTTTTVSDFLGAVEFLNSAARHEVQSGRPGKALELLGLALRMTHDASFVPFLVGPFFKERRFEPRICDELKLTLGDSEADPASLKGFLEQLDWYLARRPDAVRAFQLAKLRSVAAVEDIASGRELSLASMGSLPVMVDSRFRRDLWRASGLLLAEARHLERAFDLAMAAASKPYAQAATETSAADQKFFCHLPFWAFRTYMNMPTMRQPRPGFPEVLTRALERHTRDLANLQAARIGLGCRLHRLKFGKYPEKLTELSEKLPEHFRELPADPFTGKPLLYKKTGTGCVIWSVGPDRADDGGDEKKDIVFELSK